MASIAVRLSATVVTAGLGLAGTLPAAAGASAAAVAKPVFVQEVSAAGGHAEMYPSGVDVDGQGVVYVADTGNDQVVAYSSTDVQLWRQGVRGVRTLGNFDNPRDVAHLAGKVYVADTANQRVQILDAATGAGLAEWKMPATGPMGVTAGVDATGAAVVLVAASQTHNVWVFRPDGTLLRKVGSGPGSGDGQLKQPRDAATDAEGRIYVADYNNNRIAVFTPSGGWVGSFNALSSPQGRLDHPYGVAIDDNGELYTADSGKGRIVVTDTAGAYLRTYGSPGTDPGQFLYLRRVAVGPGSNPQVYGADLWDFRVEELGYSGQPVRRFGGVAPSAGGVNQVGGVAFGDGVMFTVDTVNQRVQRRVDGSGYGLLGTFGGRGWNQNLLGYNWPRDVAWDAADGTVWVCDTKNSRVIEYSPSGVPTGRVIGTGGPNPNFFYWPTGLSVVGGDLIVADRGKNRVVRVDPDTGSIVWAVTALGAPIDVTVSNGIVYAVESTGSKRLLRLDATDGSWLAPLGAGVLKSPYGVEVTPTGRIWVSERYQHLLRELSPTGEVVQTFGAKGSSPGKFNQPQKLIFHNGLLYVSDTLNDRVQVFSVQE